jgi:two-component system sensor histidine kinase KdpD
VEGLPDTAPEDISAFAVVRSRPTSWWVELALAAAMLTVSTLAALPLRSVFVPTNLAMFYLLGVVIVALRASSYVSVATSLLGVAAFDFFCLPPYYTFAVADPEYLVTLAAMLVVALVISIQSARIRAHRALAREKEARAEALYRLTRTLSSETRVFEAARGAAALAAEIFGTYVEIFLPEDGKISFRRRTSEQLRIPLAEESTAQWVFRRGMKAGTGMTRLTDTTAFYLPLKGTRQTFGVMAVVPDPGAQVFLKEQQELLELFAQQTALTMERTLSQRAAEESHLRMETEQMRSALLSAVSHDLRTPLASITGAASTLRSQGNKLGEATREDLLESISEEAERLSRLVSNLLDMTRFQSGSVALHRELVPLEDIIGTALMRLETRLEGRSVTTAMPEDLPPVSVDEVLWGQLVLNLVENTIKHTPPGTPIELAAGATEHEIWMDVRDRGPGFDPSELQHIFEKFYRGQRTRASGAGLGLAICQAIAQAHGGSIEAFNRMGGGASVRVRLPRVLESWVAPV